MANLVATTITGNLDVTGGGVITGDGSGLSGVDPFASGTKMVFYQASAPTGWTQDTTAALGDAAFRIVTGTGGGTGGTDSFATTFSGAKSTETKDLSVSGSVDGTVGNTTLSTPTIAAHKHEPGAIGGPTQPNQPTSPQKTFATTAFSSRTPQTIAIGPFNPDTWATTGGGGAHAHPFSGNLSSANAPSASFSIPGMNLKYANVIVATKD